MANKFSWHKLPRPFFCLAPMAGVTDPVFRRMMVKYGRPALTRTDLSTRGRPDVFYTEFVSADGLCSVAQKKLLKNLKFTEKERPIVAQIFTAKPEKMEEAARLIAKLGFDGLDINMGCPDKAVDKQGAGVALIKNPKLAREIIRAARRGAPDLPLSIKTRLGYNKDILGEWLPEIIAEKPDAIILHGRTRKEMSRVPAHWDRIADAVRLAKGSGIIIVGNGDINSIEEGARRAEETGCDGIMVGRGVFANPFIFNDKVDWEKVSVQKRLKMLLEHTKLFEKFWGDNQPVLRSGPARTTKGCNGVKKDESTPKFDAMKKFFKIYASGFAGASEIRGKLMEARNAKEVEKIIKQLKI